MQGDTVGSIQSGLYRHKAGWSPDIALRERSERSGKARTADKLPVIADTSREQTSSAITSTAALSMGTAGKQPQASMAVVSVHSTLELSHHGYTTYYVLLDIITRTIRSMLWQLRLDSISTSSVRSQKRS